MVPPAVPIETAGVLIQTDVFMREKPRRPDGNSQRDKRVSSANAGSCWESPETGAETTL